MKDIIFAGFLIVLCLAISIPMVSGQAYSNAPGSDQSYCVQSGYLYRTDPTVNNGKGICQFPDDSWCDAHAFAIGSCAPSLIVMYDPFVYPSEMLDIYSNTISPVTLNQAIATCHNAGGEVQTVHSPYGDVDLCVFPNGSTVDLMGLYGGIYSDSWHVYASSWLNAP
jgi:putative hemolysin